MMFMMVRSLERQSVWNIPRSGSPSTFSTEALLEIARATTSRTHLWGRRNSSEQRHDGEVGATVRESRSAAVRRPASSHPAFRGHPRSALSRWICILARKATNG